MTISFSRRTRSLLLLVSAACYLASFTDAGEPLDARGLGGRGPIVVPERWSTPIAVEALVRRDPFLADPTPAPLLRPPPATDDEPVVPDIDPRADALGAAVPAKVTPAFDPLVVRATIVGRRPLAFVASGRTGETIVGLGDRLGGARVRAIDLQGVVLTDGTRLDLPSSYLATPRPAARVESRADAALDAVANLRTLLLHSHLERDAASRARTAAVTPLPQPPSPGPLRTVDARGLVPGVNPTPDLTDPTAQPYPYPYAPVPH